MSKPDQSTIDEIASKVIAQIGGRPGANTQELRSIRHEVSKQLRKALPRTVIAVGLRLLDEAKIGHRFVAYELIKHHQAARRSLRAKTWCDSVAAWTVGEPWTVSRVTSPVRRGASGR